MNFQDKIIESIEAMHLILKKLEKEDKIIVFTNGCFDIIHLGHISYLEKAKHYGDILIVGINSDDSVKSLKGPNRPIKDILNRSAVIAGLASVDYVISFSEETPSKLIEIIKPDILVKGGDYNIDQIVGAKYVMDNGGSVEIIDFVKGISSSKFIDRLKL
ncbi:MAG: D-glycero-beta-D-manno-heptose 1-phosphate adenylyltransferase [Saprospiraceae bacterium]